MNAREDLAAVLLNGGAATNALATGLLDAFAAEERAAALAEARTTWPSAVDLQQAAATKRASGTPEDVAVANLLNAVANTLAWLAPYRGNEGGFEMWGAATTVAQIINGTAPEAPDFFQPGHSYTHRDGSTFRCVAVTTHPDSGKRAALGWHTDTADWTFVGVRNIDHWNHEYDGCQPPPGPDTAYTATCGEPGEGQ